MVIWIMCIHIKHPSDISEINGLPVSHCGISSSYRTQWGLLCFLCFLQGTWCIHRCRRTRRRGGAWRRWWWCLLETESASSLLRSWMWLGPWRAGPRTRPARGWRWPRSASCHSPASATLPWGRRIGEMKKSLSEDNLWYESQTNSTVTLVMYYWEGSGLSP